MKELCPLSIKEEGLRAIPIYKLLCKNEKMNYRVKINCVICRADHEFPIKKGFKKTFDYRGNTVQVTPNSLVLFVTSEHLQEVFNQIHLTSDLNQCCSEEFGGKFNLRVRISNVQASKILTIPRNRQNLVRLLREIHKKFCISNFQFQYEAGKFEPFHGEVEDILLRNKIPPLFLSVMFFTNDNNISVRIQILKDLSHYTATIIFSNFNEKSREFIRELNDEFQEKRAPASFQQT
jgi:hypothetical protein